MKTMSVIRDYVKLAEIELKKMSQSQQMYKSADRANPKGES